MAKDVSTSAPSADAFSLSGRASAAAAGPAGGVTRSFRAFVFSEAGRAGTPSTCLCGGDAVSSALSACFGLVFFASEK